MRILLYTHRKGEAEKVTAKILNLLYHLEDLNSYKKNKLREIISYFEEVKWEIG